MVNQALNQALNIEAFLSIIFLWSLQRVKGALGDLLLFLPKISRLGVIKSRFSRSDVRFFSQIVYAVTDLMH